MKKLLSKCKPKRFMKILLCFVMVFSLVGQINYGLSNDVHAEDEESETTIIDSGTCGENVTWTLDSNGLMTISGTGDMTDYAVYGTNSRSYNDYIDSIVNIVVEEGVTSIGSWAFTACQCLEHVDIANSVTSIGGNAFYQSSLSSINLSNNIASIEEYTFYETNLTSISIPDGVTSIGDGAFCQTGLVNVDIPDSVLTIGESAFEFCANLTSITLSSNLQSIGSNAFYYTRSLNSINIPDTVTEIGSTAFRLSAISSIVIPEGITTIEFATFYDCDDLVSVTLPSTLTEIDYEAFCSCENLTSINIPDSVQYIGSSAFYGCNSLAGGIIIPDGVDTLSDMTFQGCWSLEYVYIPKSVTTIDNGALGTCTNLANLYYAGSEDEWEQITKYSMLSTDLEYTTIHYNSAYPGTNTNSFYITGDDYKIYEAESTQHMSFTYYASSDDADIDEELDAIVWESSDTSIAEVAYNGAIKGNIYGDSNDAYGFLEIMVHKAGTITITGTSADGRVATKELSIEPELQLSKSSSKVICTVSIDQPDYDYLDNFIDNLTIDVPVLMEEWSISNTGLTATYTCTLENEIFSSETATVTSAAGQSATINLGLVESITPECGYEYAELRNLTCEIVFTEQFNVDNISGYVYLVSYDSNEIIEKRELSACSLITGDSFDVYKGFDITFAHTNSLNVNERYYVLIDKNAITFENGETFDGISSKNTWNFTTCPMDYISLTNRDITTLYGGEDIDLSLYSLFFEGIMDNYTKFFDNPEDGICSGIAYTVAAYNKGYPFISSYLDSLSSLNYGNLKDEIGNSYTLLEYMQLGHIYRLTKDIQNEREQNKNKYDDLYNAMYDYLYNNGDPIIIGINYYDDDGKKAGHELLPVGIISEDDNSIVIAVYDSNHELNSNYYTTSDKACTYIQTLVLLKNNGKIYGVKDYNNKEMILITYETIDSIVDDIASSNISTIQNSQLVYTSDNYTGLSTNDSFIEITSDNGGTTSSSTNYIFYWTNETSVTREAMDSNELSEIGITNGYLDISANAGLDAEVTVDLEAKTATINYQESSSDKSYTITYAIYDDDLNETIYTISGEGNVTTTQTDDGIVVLGDDMSNVVINVTLNDDNIDDINISTDKDKIIIIMDEDNNIIVKIDNDDDTTYDEIIYPVSDTTTNTSGNDKENTSSDVNDSSNTTNDNQESTPSDTNDSIDSTNDSNANSNTTSNSTDTTINNSNDDNSDNTSVSSTTINDNDDSNNDTSNTTTSASNVETTTQTGDNASYILYVGIAVAALVALLVLNKKKFTRKYKKN